MNAQEKSFWFSSVRGENIRPEIHLIDSKVNGKLEPQIINIGYCPIVIDKLYGPLIFANIRIEPDFEKCEWVVSRQNIKTNEWEEAIRIPGQKDEEFE